jgi:Zn-dependent metalloprotease
MSSPTDDSVALDNYKNYVRGVDVHYSSGIMNNAFYLMSQGGVNLTSQISVSGFGRDRAERIFYRALTIYLQPSSDFSETCKATVKSALDLYDSATANIVQNSWYAVGVTNCN